MKIKLKPQIFKLPVKQIKEGLFSDKYFVRTKQILKKDNHHPNVLMQIFTRDNGIVCGIDEVAAVLKYCADNPEKLILKALRDGDKISIKETVMTIEGDYSAFAHLETVYLGILARRTAIATIVKDLVEAAKPKGIIYFGARFDHFLNQQGDGYAATVGGAIGVSTDANAAWIKGKSAGTIPHGLIAAYNGDTTRACLAFDKYMPSNIKRIALVDFENNCVKTSLEAARVLGKKLWAVRLDTAEDIRDVSVTGTNSTSYGVCPELVFNVRKALDKEGFGYVKIIVSGGFNVEKIKRFMETSAPFDLVGVGSAILRKKIDFTADIVMLDGSPCAKVGRKFNPNPRMKLIKPR